MREKLESPHSTEGDPVARDRDLSRAKEDPLLGVALTD